VLYEIVENILSEELRVLDSKDWKGRTPLMLAVKMLRVIL